MTSVPFSLRGGGGGGGGDKGKISDILQKFASFHSFLLFRVSLCLPKLKPLMGYLSIPRSLSMEDWQNVELQRKPNNLRPSGPAATFVTYNVHLDCPGNEGRPRQ